MRTLHITTVLTALLMVFQVQAQTADLSVTQSSNVTRATVGQNVIYTLTASNAGPDTNTQVLVTDELPAEVSVVNLDPACMPDVLNPNLINCGLSLASGATQNLTIEVKVNALPSAGPRVYLSGTHSDGVSTGFFRSWVDSGQFDVIGASPGYMANPHGVFWQDDGGVLIADSGDDLLLTAPVLEDGSIFYAHPLQALGSTVATSNFLVNPHDVIKAPNGTIYVADTEGTRYDVNGMLTADTSGRIIAIDPMTGAQSVVSEGNLMAAPTGLIWDNGVLVVSDDVAGLYQVDPVTGNQTSIAGIGTLQSPKAVTGANGVYYVADFMVGIVKIDTNTLTESVWIANGAGVTNPIDIDIFNGSQLYVLNGGGSRTIERYNLSTGQSIGQLSLAANMSGVQGLAVDTGESYLLNNAAISSNGAVPDDNFLNDNSAMNTPVDNATTVQLLVSENITVSDNVIILPRLSLLVNENISVNDAVQVTPPLQLLVSENITVSDNVIILPSVSLLVSENISVNDAVQVTPPLQLLVSENITVSDNVIILPSVSLLVSENISVNDAVASTAALQVLITEHITVTDAVSQQILGFAPPQIVQVKPVSGLCQTQMSDGDVLPAASTELEISFSVNMEDPAGDNTLVDVTNPNNYRLVSTTDATEILPSNCTDPLAANSIQHAINMRFYDANSKTVVISSPYATGLPQERYKLIACYDGLSSLDGKTLDGNGDGVAGDDYAISFSVKSQNLLNNPNFSEGLASWMGSSAVTADLQDADNALLAGSALLPATSTISQCVNLNGEQSLRFGSSLRAQMATGVSSVGLDYFSDVDCTGSQLDTQMMAKSLTSSWLDTWLDSHVPNTALSVMLRVDETSSTSPLLLDRSYLITAPNVIFSDGFEQADTSNAACRYLSQ
ncbi:MAG: hypothetical protein ACWA5R_11255 [bacterium]